MTIGESQNTLAAATAPESGDTTAPETVDNGTSAEGGDENHQEPRLFTQDEVDALVTKRLGIEQRRLARQKAEQADQPRQPAKEAPKPDQFKTAQEYIDAVSDWKADQKVAERAQRQQQTSTVNTFQERAEQARDKYPDFDKVVGNDDLIIGEPSAQAILESKIGPEIAYHLGKNPQESERIARLSPLAQAREIGKIEAKLEANLPQGKKAVTSAPEPITPIGTRATSPSYSTSDQRSLKLPPSEWIAKRNAEIAAKNKR